MKDSTWEVLRQAEALRGIGDLAGKKWFVTYRNSNWMNERAISFAMRGEGYILEDIRDFGDREFAIKRAVSFSKNHGAKLLIFLARNTQLPESVDLGGNYVIFREQDFDEIQS
jgi:hypothetical protein